MRQIKQLTTVDFSLSYVSKSVVPDPEYAYAIRYDESAWSSDKLSVDVSSMGLLDKVHFKAEDTTDKIVLKVGELAKEAAKAFVSFGEVAAEAKEAGSLPPGEECIKARTESVTRVDLTSAFDPLSRTEIESVNAAIKSRAAGKSLTLDVQQSRQPIGNTLAPASKCKVGRSEEHTSELQSLMRISYAVFCLKKKKK